MDEIRREAEAVIAMGHKRVLMESGERGKRRGLRAKRYRLYARRH